MIGEWSCTIERQVTSADINNNTVSNATLGHFLSQRPLDPRRGISDALLYNRRFGRILCRSGIGGRCRLSGSEGGVVGGCADIE